MNSQVFVAVHAVLCRFFAAFDKRNWEAMGECLAPEIFIDYSSSGREPPGLMTREAFVTNRMTAVDNLTKQHSFSNLVVTDYPNDHRVGASCNYLILRFDLDNPNQEENFFHSCGEYVFDLVITDPPKICGIKQLKLQSWGNKTLHAGTTPRLNNEPT